MQVRRLMLLLRPWMAFCNVVVSTGCRKCFEWPSRKNYFVTNNLKLREYVEITAA